MALSSCEFMLKPFLSIESCSSATAHACKHCCPIQQVPVECHHGGGGEGGEGGLGGGLGEGGEGGGGGFGGGGLGDGGYGGFGGGGGGATRVVRRSGITLLSRLRSGSTSARMHSFCAPRLAKQKRLTPGPTRLAATATLSTW